MSLNFIEIFYCAKYNKFNVLHAKVVTKLSIDCSKISVIFFHELLSFVSLLYLTAGHNIFDDVLSSGIFNKCRYKCNTNEVK